MRVLQGALAVALAASSCSEARSREGTLANPVSWDEEVASLFDANCTSCHSGATPAGGYRTTSYLDALGPTSAPVAVAGDADSLLLHTIDPALSDAELSVLRLLRSELSQREIGQELHLSINTIKTHTRSIYRKLGATTRDEALERARDLSLV